MQNKTNQKLWLIPCLMLVTLLCAGYTAAQDNDRPAQRLGVEKVESIFDEQAGEYEETTYTPPADIEEKLESLKLPQDVHKYLKDKYHGLRKEGPASTLQQTQYGPEGDIRIMYDIKKGWDSARKKGESREERARSLAKAYIEEEPGLFGVFDIGELREIRINTDKGYGGDYTFITYHRYINKLELIGWYYQIITGPDETVVGVIGKIVAPTPALYQAAAKRTIGRGKIFKIIRDDLKSSDSDVSVGVSKAAKEAVVDPPYVIWNVEAKSYKPVNGGMYDWQWEFKIDPFTGEIIQKRKRPGSF